MEVERRMECVWFLFHKTREAQDLGNLKEFEYFLHSLIVMARSITSIIQKEFKHHPKFEKWYPPVQKKLQEDALCKYFVNQRNIILKEGSTEKVATINPIGFPSQKVKSGTHFSIRKKDGKIECKMVDENGNDIKGKIVLRHKYYFKGKEDTQALILIHQYLRMLEDIVTDCKRTFRSKR